MSNINPTRCPFLIGQLNDEVFDAFLHGKQVKVNFQCSICTRLFNQPTDRFPVVNGCLNGNYLSCQWYSRKIIWLSLQIPTICPLCDEKNEKCKVDQSKCDHYLIDITVEDLDYRECWNFSKWFWDQVKKKNTITNLEIF